MSGHCRSAIGLIEIQTSRGLATLLEGAGQAFDISKVLKGVLVALMLVLVKCYDNKMVLLPFN